MSNVKGSDTLDASIKTINPEVAKKMLAEAHTNRPPSAGRIARYSQAMERGEWRIAQPLMLDREGRLIEGQKRLRAVIQCKKPIEFLVIKGFDREETFGVIDITEARRLAHWLYNRGEPLPEVLAPMVAMAAKDEAGFIPTSYSGAFRLTEVEGLAFLDTHPKLRESVAAPGTVSTLASRAMLCFCHYKFAQKDRVLANSFFVDLAIDQKEGDGDPIYLLREQLKSNRVAKAKLPRTEILALIIKAWNAVRKDVTIGVLRWPTGEKFPEVE